MPIVMAVVLSTFLLAVTGCEPLALLPLRSRRWARKILPRKSSNTIREMDECRKHGGRSLGMDIGDILFFL
jgi:hypothetical protein